MLFSHFLDEIYLPVSLPKLAASTQNRSRGVLANYLRPRFGDARLNAISVLDVDRFLTTLAAKDLTHESLDKIRDVLSGVFSAAVRYGYLDRNPARGLRLPRAKLRRAHRAWITPDQLAAIVDLMAEPYATMVYTAAWTGLRVSELIGLRWRNVGSDSITVAERCCRGDWGEPKTEASAATIPVNRSVLDRLGKRGAPDALVFRTACGRPLRDNNVLVRHLKPAARQLGLGWVNWLVLRRSFATWLKLAGADVKDAQGLMRHARASTTRAQRVLHIRDGKTPAARRAIRLVGNAWDTARDASSARNASQWLFPDRDRNYPLIKVSQTHRKICDRAGLTFCLYDLRHTFATRMAERGMPLTTLASILGHSGLRCVMRYIHPGQQTMNEAMDRFSAA